MNILYSVVEVVHYVVCAGLIIIVLLQAGKSGGMAGIFGGGGGSDQIFNAPSGMAFIKKVTVVFACIFVITSITMTKLSTSSSRSVVGNVPVATAPVR